MPHNARAVLLVAFAVSCSVNLEPPPDVVITCEGNDQCPTDYRCSSQLGRCVPGGQEDVPPRILNLTATVERDVGAAPGTAVEAAAIGSTVRVRFQVDEELLEPPLVRLSWPDDDEGYAREAAATPTSTGFEMVTTILATDPVGAVSVGVIAIDTASNVGNAELPRHFLVDTTPFLLGSASLKPSLPVPTELTAVGVEVTAARNEAPGIPEVEAQLVFSKPPRLTPVVTLEGPGGSIEGTVSALASTSFAVTFEIDDTLATAAAGDTFELAISAYDAAGISWTLPAGSDLPTIVIDTSPPAIAANLRFLRAPWGGGDALPERTFAVESLTAGALIGSAGQSERLFVHDSQGLGRARLGFAPLAAAGTLPGDRLLLATADRLEVFATLVDAAGNEGQTLRVADGRWVATFKDRTAGNDFLNPNRLTRVSEPGDALFDPLATEAATADIVRTVSADADRFTHSVSSGVWRFRRLGSPPEQLAGGAVYVPSSGNVQLVGGSSEDIAFPNVWNWDGRDWREVDLIGTLWPGEAFGPAVAHDSARDRTVYHGGTITATPSTRTWEYDGTTWFDVTPDVPGPPAVFAPMVYDPIAGVMVLYGAFEDPGGGCTPEPVVNKCLSTTTWLWDGSAWEAVPCSGGQCPPARTFTSMAYDAESQRVVLFGGTDALDATGVLFGDLWEWDTATRTWTEVTPVSGTVPSPRRSALMSYVAGFGGVLIWGGCEEGEFFDCAKDDDSGGPDNLEALLVWKGSAATPAFATITAADPGNLGGPLLSRGIGQTAYIPSRDQMLLFGGARQLNVPLVPDCTPYAGGCDGADPHDKGGGLKRCVCSYDNGWLLQPTSATTAKWSQVAGESAVHSPVQSFSMTYSPDDRRTYIFGGRAIGDCDENLDNDLSNNCHSLWSWDGVRVRPEPVRSAPLSNVVIQGQCGGWNQSAPCGHTEHAATYLPLAKQVAHFDAPEQFVAGFYNEGLWRYDPAGPPWFFPPVAAATQATSPPTTESYAIATSVVGATETVYLFGGFVNGGGCGVYDTRYGVNPGTTQPYGTTTSGGACLSRALWRWTSGGGWQLFLPPLSGTAWPSPRSNMSLVEIEGGRLMLFGGCISLSGSDCAQGATTNGDTWVLTPGATPSWTCVSGTSATCGAVGASDPGPLNGSRMTWDKNAKRVLMFGGSELGDGPGPNDLWSWREPTPGAGEWSRIDIEGVKPITRKRHGLAYDSNRNVLMLAGEGRVGEIWELAFDLGNRPVMVFDFALRNAGLSEAAGVARASDAVVGIHVYLDVVASSFDGTDPVDGMVMQMWHSGLARWFDIGQSFSPGGVFAGVCNYDTDAVRPGRQVRCDIVDDEARSLVFAGDDHIYARIAPASGVSDDGTAAVLSLDAVRLEVDYALP